MYQLVCDICNKRVTTDEVAKMNLQDLEVHVCRLHNRQKISNKVTQTQFAIQDLEFNFHKNKMKLIDEFYEGIKSIKGE